MSYEQYFRAAISVLLLNQTASFETIHLWHGDVEDNDVGMQSLDLVDGLGTIRCFPYDYPIAPSLEKSPKPLPNDRMIVHQQDANSHKLVNSLMRHRADPTGLTANFEFS